MAIPVRPNIITDRQIAGVAQGAGFRGNALVIAVAVALGESSGDTNAHNYNRATGDDSYGLWQINMLDELGPARRQAFGLSTNEELYNPSTNARAAYAISSNGTNFRPWSVYKSGAYLRYMSRAREAAGNPDTSGAGTGAEQTGVIPDFGGALSWPSQLTDFFEMIIDPVTWIRLGMLIAGGVLVLLALFAISGQDQKAKMLLDFVPGGKAVKSMGGKK
jgi:hypothetical protein